MMPCRQVTGSCADDPSGDGHQRRAFHRGRVGQPDSFAAHRLEQRGPDRIRLDLHPAPERSSGGWVEVAIFLLWAGAIGAGGAQGNVVTLVIALALGAACVLAFVTAARQRRS
jgi:hypothetical protein